MDNQVKIYYKSDFKANIECDMGWELPFVLTFWVGTNKKSSYEVSYDGETWTGCRVSEDDDKVLEVAFDDHGLGLGTLMMELHYMSADSLMPSGVFDAYIEPQVVKTKTSSGALYTVILDRQGDDSLTIMYELPMLAAETQRRANEIQRQENEVEREIAESARTSTFNSLKTTIEAWFDGAKSSWNGWVDDTKNTWQTWYGDVQSAWNTWFSSIKSAWSTWYGNTQSAWSTWYGNTQSAWKTFNDGAASAEQGRASAETSRSNAESARVSAEQGRASAETSRSNAESARVSAEQGRVSAESSRVSAESSRATTFNTLKSNIDAWYSGTQSAWSAWFSSTKNAWNTFNATATAAESARVSEWQNKSGEIDTAIGRMDVAVASAESAAESAQEASTQASQAVTDAETAINNANAAVNTANTASDTALASASTANTAASNAYQKAQYATTKADESVERVNVALRDVADKEYAYIRTTPSAMRELIESGTVNEGKQYLVIANNRVVGIYFGSKAQAGCELGVADITLVGSSSLA